MKKTSQVDRVFDEDDIVKFEKAVSKDKIIIHMLTQLIEDSISELSKPTSLKDFERSSWALERAYRDGGAYHLQQILNIFKEK